MTYSDMPLAVFVGVVLIIVGAALLLVRHGEIDTLRRLAHVETGLEALKAEFRVSTKRIEDSMLHQHTETRQQIGTLVQAVTGQSASFLNQFEKMRLALLNESEKRR
jgi:hypothetical protein